MPRVAIRRVLFATAATALAATTALAAAGASGGAVASAATAAPAISTGFTALGGLSAVSATSPSNAWAVGATAKETTKGIQSTGSLTVHWNGASWTKVPSPGPATATLAAVDAVSATDAWAVGDTTNGVGGKPFIIHWNGKAWTQTAVPSLADAYLDSVAATSPSNAWVVGAYQNRPLILHWNGKAWSVVPGAPAEKYSELTGVAATSAGNAWTVGCPCGGGPTGIVTSRWNGKSWAIVPQPVRSEFGSGGEIAAVGALAWATTQSCKANCGGNPPVTAPLLMRWTGKKWQVTANPLPVTALVEGLAVTSASNAWAVGRIETSPTTIKTFILHWNGKAWS